MFFSLPIISDEGQTKIFVIIASAIQLVISLLCIAYFASTQDLYKQQSKYSIRVTHEPIIGYYCFYGIQAIAVNLLILIDALKPDLISLQKSTKWWIFWFSLVGNSIFSFAVAVGGADTYQFYDSTRTTISNFLKTATSSTFGYDYAKQWDNTLKLLLAIVIMMFVLAWPLYVILTSAMVKKINSNRSNDFQGVGNKTVIVGGQSVVQIAAKQ